MRPPCAARSGGRLVLAVAALASALAPGVAPAVRARDLADLSLTDLMAVEVTSVSKRAERLATTPAAVTVLTNDDIRRSGATNLPDLLRLVPGVQVARASSDSWAVSIRGFNDIFANKLLVLVDGRSVYTPLFAGVYWDVQDVVLDDVERIEVIRGPGSAVWGANAVNGVINVITKNAADTQGGLVSAGGGDEEQGFGAARYGGALGEHAFLRAYAKGFRRDGLVQPDGSDAHDDWYQARTGFRADGTPSATTSWTLQGDGYVGRGHETVGVVASLSPYATTIEHSDIDVQGANILGRWVGDFGDSGRITARAYWDYTRRDSIQLPETRNTGDLEIQHEIEWWERNQLVIGGGSRVTVDSVHNTLSVELDPSSRTEALLSSFVENRTSLADDALGIVLGTRLEWNERIGFEVQPTARLAWTPDPNFTLWGAASRAVRTSAGNEEHVVIRSVPIQTDLPSAPPITVAPQIQGSDDAQSETLMAFEVGARGELHRGLTLEIAGFFNRYDDLLSLDLQPLGPDALAVIVKQLLDPDHAPPLLMPIRYGNTLEADSYGVEIEARWQVLTSWALTGSYTFLEIDARRKDDSTDFTSRSEYEGASPKHQLRLRSQLDLPNDVDLDVAGLWVDALDYLAAGSPIREPAYLRLDARLGWRPRPDLELAIVGQDLLDGQHSEFTNTSRGRVLETQVQRGVHAKATWTF